MKPIAISATALFLGLLAPAASSVAQPAVRAYTDPWRYTGGVSYTDIKSSGSISRKDGSEYGLRMDADNAQSGGVGGGISHSIVNYNNGNPQLHQNNFHLTGRMYQRENVSGGRIMYRLDYLHVDNTDSTGLTDKVNTWAPKIGLLTAKGGMLVDLEYAHSSYKQGLRVKQFAPSVGFAFNDSYDWINFKIFHIRNNKAAERAMNKSATNALEITWTHYFGQSNNQWLPANLSGSVVIGERIYKVDTNAGSISNLAHISRNSFSVGANWKLTRDLNLNLLAGESNAVEPGLLAGSANVSYRTRFAYIGLSTTF